MENLFEQQANLFEDYCVQNNLQRTNRNSIFVIEHPQSHYDVRVYDDEDIDLIYNQECYTQNELALILKGVA